MDKKFERVFKQVRPGQNVALPPQIFNCGRYCGVSLPCKIYTHNQI